MCPRGDRGAPDRKHRPETSGAGGTNPGQHLLQEFVGLGLFQQWWIQVAGRQ